MADMDELFGSDGDSDSEQHGKSICLDSHCGKIWNMYLL